MASQRLLGELNSKQLKAHTFAMTHDLNMQNLQIKNEEEETKDWTKFKQNLDKLNNASKKAEETDKKIHFS